MDLGFSMGLRADMELGLNKGLRTDLDLGLTMGYDLVVRSDIDLIWG